MEYALEINSFLSPNVRHLLVDIGKEYQGKHANNKSSYLTECGTFIWEKVDQLLDTGSNFKIHNQPSSWFVTTVHKLWEVYLEAHHFLLHSDKPCQDVLWNLCAWTGKQLEVKEHYEWFFAKDVSTTETSLFLTALLERSLGNIFLMKENQVPSLLRDLLETSELLSVLGCTTITFLQILIGTPSGINLRNIVWHGFPRPGEIHPELVSTLFIAMASVGQILNSRNISLDLIPRRVQMCYEPELFSEYFPDVSDQCSVVLKILYQSNFIACSHRAYWETGLKHFRNGKYGFCLQLLMPQMEHLLRCIFCAINDCPNRMLTAESTAFYTTLNEIMAELVTINNDDVRKNKLWSLGDSGTLLEMLQDLFVHQAGPRIRDKIGHGECNLYEIPKQLVNHVICVALVFVLKSKELCIFESDHLSKHSQVISVGVEAGDVLKLKIMHTYETYCSIYHPSSLLKKSIIAIIHSLDEWETHPRPFAGDMSNPELMSCVSENILQLQNLLHKSLKDLGYTCDVSSEQICLHLSSLKILTIFRPKKESEIVSILRHIVNNIQLISFQVNQQLLEKFLIYSQHKMRSRNRETYHRMLEMIPNLKRMIFCVILIVVIWLHKINMVISMPGEEYSKSLKFLKKNLQFVENIVSYTNLEKNKWTEASLLGERFCQDMCVVWKT